MDILSFKRRALGYMARGEDGSSDGSDSHLYRQGDPTAYNGATQGSNGGWYSSGSSGNTQTAADQAAADKAAADKAAADKAAADSAANQAYVQSIGGWGREAAPDRAKPADTMPGDTKPTAETPTTTEGKLEAAPEKKGLLYRLGIRAPGTTAEQMFNSETKAERDDRMGLVSNIIGRTAQAFTPAPVGMIANGIAAYQSGKPLENVIRDGVFDVAAGKVAGAINGQVAKALGPDAMQAVGAYNTVASMANIANPGTLPGFNLGRMATNGIGSAMGIGRNGAPTGLTSPSTGETISAPVGGWSTGGSSHSSSAAPAAVQPAAVPAAEVDPLTTNMRFNFDGSGFGRAVRAGATTRGY
ncbi:MAG: hypothetical protein CGW95_12230 [Phenylobacterium zucineum]|nr:MAG: hypothetical protein CGW95_12230 [Phenylobacterium zucineum]